MNVNAQPRSGLAIPFDHARLDRLMWDGDEQAVRRMMPLVEPGHRALALARIKLMKKDDSAVVEVVSPVAVFAVAAAL